MLPVDRTLLCLAALVLHGFDQVTAVPHWGRFERRLAAGNETASNTVTSSDITQEASLSSSPVSEVSSAVLSDVLSDVPTAQLSVASISVDTAASSSTKKLYTAEGLGTITTVPRPTTFTFGPGTTTVVVSSSSTTTTTSEETTGVVSDTASVPLDSTSGTTFTEHYSNTSSIASSTSILSGNRTSNDLGWNSTMTVDTNLTTITIEPPPTPTVITYDQPSLVTYEPPTITDEPTADACDVTTNSNTVTVWSTIYTTTITWTLPPDLYTPPFPDETTTPVICSQTSARLSVSVCEGSTCTQYTYPAEATLTTSDGHRQVNPTATAGTTVMASSGAGKAWTPTITFYTTDKNPAVVYSTETPPNYGDSGTTLIQDHNTPDSGGYPTTSPQYEKGTTSSVTAGGSNRDSNTGAGGGGAAQTSPEAVKQSPTTSAVTVIIQTTQVIINDQTFTDSPQSQTSTVVVGTDTFVINPSEVIGAGATVIRPVVGGIFIPTATTTTVAGVEIVYHAAAGSAATAGSAIAIATIGGTTFTIGATPTTAVVKGQTITLGPGGIAIASQTIPLATAAGATESAVLGGELITAIGNSIVVIEGTTYTYGPGMSTITEVIDGDTILIGPSGVSVHGLTLGGISAARTATTYEIVGGATITQVGGSAVVIDGTTYSIGGGATSAITTIIDGQTLTIGPSGVVSSSYTFAQPYATSTVIEPGSTSSVAAATKTAESAGPSLRLTWDRGIMGMCIAIGVGFLGGLVL